MTTHSKSIIDRLRSGMLIDKKTGCWSWQRAKNRKGYGQIRYMGILWIAHRLAWEMFRGPIQPGFTIDHLCRNHGCINPDHLEPCTIKVNTLRGVGPSALCARKTHCKNGHPFSGENLLIWRGGKERGCRTCHREQGMAWDRNMTQDQRNRRNAKRRMRRARARLCK